MKIKIQKNGNLENVNIYEGNGILIREVPVKKKGEKGHITEYVDIREMKIGAELDGGIVVENSFL